MTTFNLDPGDASTARSVQLVLEATEATHSLAVQACVEAILEGSGTGDQADLYEQAFKEHGGEYLLYCRTAALYVRDAVLWYAGLGEDVEGPDDEGSQFARKLLRELLDVGNVQLWSEVADSFMPDPEHVHGVQAGEL